MKKKILLVICLFISLLSNAQIRNNEKTSITALFELNEDIEEPHTIIPLEEKGLIVAYMPEQKSIKGMSKYTFVKLDKNLNYEFTINTTIQKDCRLVDYAVEYDYVYILFSHGKGYDIVKLNYLTNTIDIYNKLEQREIELRNLVVNKGIVSISGKVITNGKTYQLVCYLSAPLCFLPLLFYRLIYAPVVITVDMNTNSYINKELLLKTYINKNVEIEKMISRDSLGNLDLLLMTYPKTSIRGIKSGKLAPEISIKKSSKEIIRDSDLIIDEEKNEKFIYGSFVGNLSAAGDNQGFYSCLMDSIGQKYFKIIPWKDFSFYKELSKYVLLHGINMSFTQMLQKGETRIFFCEIYARTPMNSSYSQNHFGAIVFCIDQKGNLLWDKLFDNTIIREYVFFQKYAFNEYDENEYHIVYNSGANIVVNKIKNNEFKLNTENIEIKGGIETREALNKYWYGNNFLIAGIKKTKKNPTSMNYKKSFYIGKVAVY